MVGKLIPISSRRFSERSRTCRSTPRRCAAPSAELAREIGDGRAAEDVADGFIKIAVENMANAIKKISVQRGYDVTRYALNCFGGAGGQHACLVADALGMTKVLIHPFSSLLSAYGMGLADIRATRQQAIEEPFGDARAGVDRNDRRQARRRCQARGGRPGRSRARHRRARARAHPLRRHRHRAGGAGIRAQWPRWPICASPPRDESRVRGRAQIALRIHRRDQGAGGRGGLGRGGRRRREIRGTDARLDDDDAPLPAPARTRFYSGGTWHDAAVFTRAQLCARPQGARPRHHHRAASDRRGRGRLAGRDHGEEPSRAGARRPARAPARDRHAGRSGDARSVQQPVHVDRRADGRVAAEHRLFGQHQGAARLLLRGVRRRRHAGRQRAAHAGASRLHGPRGRDHHPREQGQDRAGRRLRHQRALQRRHAPARHHGVHAGVRRRGARDPVLGGVARPSRRCRRHLAGLDVAERDHDRGGRRLYRQLQAGRPRPLPRAGALRRCSPARNIPRAIRCRTSTT